MRPQFTDVYRVIFILHICRRRTARENIVLLLEKFLLRINSRNSDVNWQPAEDFSIFRVILYRRFGEYSMGVVGSPTVAGPTESLSWAIRPKIP